MLFVIFILGQIAVAAIVIFFLKKKLDNILIDLAIRQLELYRGEKAIKVATVVTHKNLNPQYQEHLRRIVAKQLGESAVLSYQTDKSLLGGIIIKLGDQIMDYSLRDRLRQAKR